LKRRRKTSSEGRSSSSSSGTRPEHGALALFALITVLGPLAFGAVDRVVQIGIVAIFAIGLWMRPPQWPRLSERARRILLGAALVLVLAQFAPAVLFGGTRWRSMLHGDYGLAFPWTHHPEPGYAVDALLAMTMAAMWFVWVRTLAGARSNRAPIAWTLF